MRNLSHAPLLGDLAAPVRNPSCAPLREGHDILRSFSDTEFGLLSNARCLTEGVNIPSVDCVAFLSPKRSKVDIIQAIGRAMRKDPKNPDKKTGYVLLPLLVEDGVGESEEETVAATNFDEIWDVLGSLNEFDPILAKVFDQISEDKGANKDSNPFDLLNDHMEIIGTCLSSDSLKKEIGIRIIDKLTSGWHIRYGELKVFKEHNGHCNVVQTDYRRRSTKKNNDYNKIDYKKLGIWVMAQRQSFKADRLKKDRIEKLETIGFEWAINSTWEEQYGQLKLFKKEHGHCNVAQKGHRIKSTKQNHDYDERYYKNLGLWVRTQRVKYKEGGLTKDKIEKLEIIGFEWVKRDPSMFSSTWEEHFNCLVEYKNKNGHANVLWKKGELLARWCNSQKASYKNGKLSKDRIRKLVEIGFNLESNEHITWDIQFKKLYEYYKKYRDTNVPQNWEEDVSLANWVDNQ